MLISHKQYKSIINKHYSKSILLLEGESGVNTYTLASIYFNIKKPQEGTIQKITDIFIRKNYIKYSDLYVLNNRELFEKLKRLEVNNSQFSKSIGMCNLCQGYWVSYSILEKASKKLNNY